MMKRFLSGLVGVAMLLHGAPTVSATPTLLWSANHEVGSQVEWYRDFGGGEFGSGCAGVQPSIEVARSGLYSLKLTICAPCGASSSGARAKSMPDLTLRTLRAEH